MSSRSGAAAEKPICVTGLGISMGDVFNPSKGALRKVSRPKLKKLEFEYTLKGETLANVSSTPYLGVCLSETLEWETHISKITSKANSTLGCLRRNLKACPPKLREAATAQQGQISSNGGKITFFVVFAPNMFIWDVYDGCNPPRPNKHRGTPKNPERL